MAVALGTVIPATRHAVPLLAQEAGASRFRVEVEAGPVWQSRNDVRIPGTTGTDFSLADVLGAGPYSTARLYVGYDIAGRHGLRLLIAPLSLEGNGTLDDPVDFAGSSFASGAVTARYRFNSYRLTYRYRLVTQPRWGVRVGLTAKIRDAEVRLSQEGVSAADSDVGFVPLLHVAAFYTPTSRLSVELDADALAAPQGRAEDVALKLRYALSDRWSLAGGYRTLEGGADTDDVYTFAWLHYAVASAAYHF